MGRTITLEEVGNRNATDLLREVARGQEPLTIILEAGVNVTLEVERLAEPAAPLKLKPLVLLSGYVPDGWKDAIYGGFARASEPTPQQVATLPETGG